MSLTDISILFNLAHYFTLGIANSDSTRELLEASFSAFSKTNDAPLFLASDKLVVFSELSNKSLLTISFLFE